jgi:hypothetical protein
MKKLILIERIMYRNLKFFDQINFPFLDIYQVWESDSLILINFIILDRNFLIYIKFFEIKI